MDSLGTRQQEWAYWSIERGTAFANVRNNAASAFLYRLMPFINIGCANLEYFFEFSGKNCIRYKLIEVFAFSLTPRFFAKIISQRKKVIYFGVILMLQQSFFDARIDIWNNLFSSAGRQRSRIYGSLVVNEGTLWKLGSGDRASKGVRRSRGSK